MSNTDPNSFAADALVRGGGLSKTSQTYGTSKTSLATADAASTAHLLSGYSWSSRGGAATVTYAYRVSGTPSDSSTSGFQQFNAAQIAQTEKALLAWSDVANIHFTRVDDGNGYSNSATILFGDYTSGDAAGYTGYPGSRASSSASGDVWINGSLSYEANPVTGNYGAQTLVHEIGHAIGLSHPSDYDQSDSVAPTYASSASYYEDSRQFTVMSYFSEQATGGYNGSAYASAPLIDDIAAAQALYGANYATRAGNTVYGFHSNTGEDWYTAQSAATKLVFAVWDGGGTDSFDFTGYTGHQTIDLRAGDFSNVGGLTGNVSIAQGVTIENAYAGSGGDTLIGNAAANALVGGTGADHIFGEGGNDIIHGGAGDDVLDGGSGVNVIDGGPGTDLLLLAGKYADYTVTSDAGGWYTISGNGVTDYVRGIEKVDVEPSGSVPSGSAAGVSLDSGLFNHAGGSPANLDAYGAAGINDFSGDGRSDILWRNDSGALSTWYVSGGTLVPNQFNASVDTGWQIAETFDMNGDGRSDILWRNGNGLMSVWLGTADGSFQQNSFTTGVTTDWRIAGVGDFDGDAKADILWQNTSGAISVWQSTGSGFNQSSYFHDTPGSAWKVEGVADLDGNGQADILWRNTDGTVSTWLAQGAGFQTGVFTTAVSNDWHVAGLADFNGDGQADILWRNGSGAITLWASTGTGFAQRAYDDASVGNEWQIAQIGDFNGDGRADILWHKSDGEVSTWQWNGHGFDENVAYAAGVSTSWHIMSHDFI